MRREFLVAGLDLGSTKTCAVIAEATGDVVYALRVPGTRFQPPVFAPGKYTIRAGTNRPDQWTRSAVTAGPKEGMKPMTVTLSATQ